MDQDEGDAGAIPEWVVTFGDMMSLLLTFFIMLVSLSEVKQKEKYQALVDSMRRQFGHDTSIASLAPGQHKPRNAQLARLSSQGRSLRANTMNGGDKVKAPVGENPRVRRCESPTAPPWEAWSASKNRPPSYRRRPKTNCSAL